MPVSKIKSLPIFFALVLVPVFGFSAVSECHAVFDSSDTRRTQVIVDGPVSSDIRGALESKIRDAIHFFSDNIMPVGEPVVATIGGEGLRTGYNFKQKKLLFPEIDNVSEYGVGSVDVVFHETFHSLLCAARPFLCTEKAVASPEIATLHEVFADLFAYFAHGDKFFGEGYFSSKPYMRNYGEGPILGLSEGEHARANSIVSLMLAEKVDIDKIRAYFSNVKSESDFELWGLARLSPRIVARIEEDAQKYSIVEPLNYPESKLSRYRVEPGSPLRLKISPSVALVEAEPNLAVQVVDENLTAVSGVEVRRTGVERGFEVIISVNDKTPARKLLISYSNGKRILGTKAVYISVKKT